MQQPKARMTFRFDNAVPASAQPLAGGEKKPSLPALEAAEPIAAALEANDGSLLKQASARAEPSVRQGKADYQAWNNSPYQDDIHALEEMIRTTEREPLSGFSRKREQQAEQVLEPVAFKSPNVPKSESPARLRTETPTWDEAEAPEDLEVRRQNSALKGFGSPKAAKAKRGETIPFPRAYQVQEPLRSETEAPDPHYPLEPAESPEPFDDESYRWTDGGHHRYREEGPSWMRVFVTVFGAIATGGLFGYLLLTLFTGEPLLPNQGTSASPDSLSAVAPLDTGADSSAAATGAPQQAAASGGEKPGSQGQASGVVVPSVSLYVLQHGVFRTEESMEEAAQKLREQGIAAATDTSDGYRVYAGISPSKAGADELVAMLAGTEVYAKSLSGDSFQIAGVEEVDEYVAFLGASSDLYNKIAAFTSESLTGGEPSEDHTILAIRTAHQLWQEKAKPAADWMESAKSSARKEIEELNAAVNALNSYSDGPKTSLLWKAQTAALNAVFADRQLRSFIQLQAGG